jgi:hypothetical protein
MTGPLDPGAPITYGRDFNFFKKITVANTTFNTDADIIITFPTQTVTFQLESGGGVQYSFNGNTVHGDLNAPSGGLIFSSNLTFQNRVISKIWFLASGSSVVRIEAWGTR